MRSNELAHADPDLIWQQCLFAFDEPAVSAPVEVHRTWLDDESWVDYQPRWMHGADLVFAELVARLPWRQRQVVMYDRLLPEPRLTAWWSDAAGTAEPLPVLGEARQRLTRHYGRPFDSIGFNLYRDGHDSVAWHGDRERYLHEDPVVAIVSVGSPRPFQMRPRGGGRSTTWMLGQGDLLVMGGACQHQWEHAVPKVVRTAGPRLSIMFRHNLSGIDYPDGATAVAEAVRRNHPSAGARD
jgi:alkylated DNA repair dioxygenase AlkB